MNISILYHNAHFDFQIPTAIVYGENDNSIGPESTKNLKNLPNHELHMIKGAGHAAWKNKPEEFHLILYEFLQKLKLSSMADS